MSLPTNSFCSFSLSVVAVSVFSVDAVAAEFDGSDGTLVVDSEEPERQALISGKRR